MSGPIVGGAPWPREALRQYRHQHPEAIAAIEELVPDGLRLNLFCHAAPGVYGAVLYSEATHSEVARTTLRYASLLSALYGALEAGKVAVA